MYATCTSSIAQYSGSKNLFFPVTSRHVSVGKQTCCQSNAPLLFSEAQHPSLQHIPPSGLGRNAALQHHFPDSSHGFAAMCYCATSKTDSRLERLASTTARSLRSTLCFKKRIGFLLGLELGCMLSSGRANHLGLLHYHQKL